MPDCRLLLLKALVKKQILVPGYTRKDGTFVPPHSKVVNIDPEIDMHHIASGGPKSSHSVKQAHKKLSKLPGFNDLPVEDKHAHILSAAQNIQTAATKGAQVSVWKKDMLAGVKPKPSNTAAFKELMHSDPEKAAKILDEVHTAIGAEKYAELLGESSPAAIPDPVPDSVPVAKFGKQNPGVDFIDPISEVKFKYQPKHGWTYYSNLSGHWKDVTPSDAAMLDSGKGLHDEPLVPATAPAPAVPPAPTVPVIEWDKYELPASNSNAPSHNKKVAQIKAFHEAGDAAGLAGMKFGSNTYGKKQAKLAEVALAHLNEFGGGSVFSDAAPPPAAPAPPAAQPIPSGWSTSKDGLFQTPGGTFKFPQDAVALNSNAPPISALSAMVGEEQFKAIAAGHYGQSMAGKTVMAVGELTIYRYDGDTGFWSHAPIQDVQKGDAKWTKVTYPVIVNRLSQGMGAHTNNLLEEFFAGGNFGQKNAGVVFDGGSYEVRYNGYLELWQTRAKSAPLGEDNKWLMVSNPKWVEALNQGKPPYGEGVLVQSETDKPAPDSSKWSFDENNPAFSDAPTYTFSDEDDNGWYVAYSDEDGVPTWEVGPVSFGDDADDSFAHYTDPADVIAHLQGKHVAPPELDDLKKMEPGSADEDGPKEGDTKQGVDGTLVFKNGRWHKQETAFGPQNEGQVFLATTGSAGFTHKFKFEGGQWWLISGSPTSSGKWEPFGNNGYWVNYLNQGISTDGTPLTPIDDAPAPAAPAAPAPAPAVSAGVESWTLHNTLDEHHKFWKIDLDLATNTITKSWGKIGTKGQSKQWHFASATKARTSFDEWKAEKLNKGYSVHDVSKPKPEPEPDAGQKFGEQHAYFVFDDNGYQVKFVPGSGWQVESDNGWQNIKSTSWLHLLDKGKGTTGKVLQLTSAKPAAKAPDLYATGGFGAAHEGDVFFWGSPGAPGGQGRAVYLKGKWHVLDDGAWQPMSMMASLKFNKGVDQNGLPLSPSGEAVFSIDGSAAAPVDDGPKVGDMKPGASGMLVFKNGRWHKAWFADVLAKFPPPELPLPSLNAAMADLHHEIVTKGPVVLDGVKKTATTKNGLPNLNLTIPLKGKLKKWSAYAKMDGVWKPYFDGSSTGASVAGAVNHALLLKEAFAAFAKNKPLPVAPTAPAAPVAAPAPAPKVSSVKVVQPGDNGEAIDGWQKVGEQGGYNPGGTYQDGDGTKWYCKFPTGGAKVVRNELLANKLYAAVGVGVPEVKLVTQNGQIGIASKIIDGAVKDKAALLAGKADGLLSGFMADAWLANWDVVGNNPASGKGWDNIMFKGGVAHRIDPGGALLYGGAGGKKGEFGDQVIEIDTMRNAAVNARTAAVFGNMSDADLNASAAKVLALSDATISEMVEQFGPGDSVMKSNLAAKLIARKKFIADKFPKAAKKAATTQAAGKVALPSKKKVDPSDTSWVNLKPGETVVETGEKFGIIFAKIKVPPSGFNAAGIPKPPEYTASSKPHVNAMNTADLKRIYDMAVNGSSPEQIKNITFDEISKETGEKTGKLLTIEQHPSTKYLLEYHSQVMAEVKAQLEPTYRVQHSGSFAESYSRAAKSIASKVKKLAHSQFASWKEKAADYLVLDRSVGEAIPAPDKGHFKEVSGLSDPIISDWAAKSKSQMAALPASQRSAIKSYTGSSYASWNTAMRLGQTESSGWTGSENLRKAFDNAAVELPEGIILHRGISVGNQTFKSVVGAVIQDGSFQSTSYGSKAAFSGHTSQLRLHVTAGVKAVLADHLSVHNEREILLDRNCRYLVMGVDGGNVDILVLPHEA